MPQVSGLPFDISEIATQVLDQMGVSVTIFDPKGVMLYYNRYAPNLLERRPELLGEPVQDCHKLEKSRQMIDDFIRRFQEGESQEIFYWAKVPGPPRAVRIRPLFQDGELVACVQTVMKLDSLPES